MVKYIQMLFICYLYFVQLKFMDMKVKNTRRKFELTYVRLFHNFWSLDDTMKEMHSLNLQISDEDYLEYSKAKGYLQGLNKELT